MIDVLTYAAIIVCGGAMCWWVFMEAGEEIAKWQMDRARHADVREFRKLKIEEAARLYNQRLARQRPAVRINDARKNGSHR